MRRWLLAALLPLTPSLAFAAGTPLPDGPHLAVSGEGEVSIAPDAVVVEMEAQSRSDRPADAKRAVDRAVNALLELAPRFGISPDDVSASDLELREDIDYDDNDNVISRGHIATREVTVRLTDLERLGEYIDSALDAGFTDVVEVAFKSSREDSLREQARALAVADANEKAEGLATAFGGTLGLVYSINSVNSRHDYAYGSTTLDRIQVTGSRIPNRSYLQPTIEFTERVSAVFELTR